MNSHFVEETEPLLGGTTEILNGHHQQQHHHRRRCQAENASSSSDTLVDFDPKGDSANPQEWPKPFKWGITMLLTLMGFAVTFNCVGVVPVASRISADLSHGTADKSASVLLVTIWELGEAAGPLLIAPLSETVGRYPVINVCTTLFVLATAGAALSRSTAAFVTARLLSGLFVTSNVLNPAVVGDMFGPEDRGSPMSLCLLSPLIGGAVGPAISGAVAETLSWRWALWIAAGLAALCEVLFLTCFRETYRAAILKKRAKARGDGEHVDGERGLRGLLEAIARPGFVFRSSGVLMALSLYGSVIFAQFYVVSVTLPDILTEIYGLSPAQTGFGLMSFSVGSSASLVFCNTFLDRIYVKLRAANDGRGLPEHRLPISIAGGLALPVAMAAYGWIAHLALPLWALLLSVMVFGNALMLANVPLSAYVVDAFGPYSASAMTGLIVARCLMGTFLPLLTTPLIEGFGRGWAFTVLAGANLVLAPVPMLVFRYGERWRRGSKYTRDA